MCNSSTTREKRTTETRGCFFLRMSIHTKKKKNDAQPTEPTVYSLLLRKKKLVLRESTD